MFKLKVWVFVGFLVLLLVLGTIFFRKSSVDEPVAVIPPHRITNDIPPDVKKLASKPKEPSEDIVEKNDEVSVERGKRVGKTAPKIGTPEWMKWYQSLSPEDRRSWAMAQDDMAAAPEPTPAQKAEMQIKQWDHSTNGVFSSIIMTNFKSILKMEAGTSIRPLQIKTTRTDSGLISTIWARRAQNVLQVNWSNKSISDSNIAAGESGEGPVSQVVPQDMFLTSRGNEIGYKNGNKSFKTKWEPAPDSLVFPLALDSEFHYAFGLVRRESKGQTVVDQIVALDIEKKVVADIVSIPPVDMGASVIFDTKTEFLLVLDPGWQWMMMLDLKKVKSDKK